MVFLLPAHEGQMRTCHDAFSGLRPLNDLVRAPEIDQSVLVQAAALRPVSIRENAISGSVSPHSLFPLKIANRQPVLACKVHAWNPMQRNSRCRKEMK